MYKIILLIITKGLEYIFFHLVPSEEILTINSVYFAHAEHLFLHNESAHQIHANRINKKSDLEIRLPQSLKVLDFRLELA
jgi:hypothetical protein